ncbi:transcriptional regulator, MarR family [Chitinophaga sp. CF118]|uniref:MarR family winged helix-turn-helix transcriptional regulator n=1 Tax=Chitinophaga sp. CF118 TaxID=1884367 RepID=UPI0008E9769D|nr:MarR family transcriptional regulator [Chitinophaga sp. CF118]SFD74734.1 transcriptional regulator, MarR family [Chitinophaga sp. CF118]
MKANDKIFSVEKSEESSGFLLWQVTTLWQREIKNILAPLDLTHPQFVLMASLMWLSQQQETVTQIDISNHSKIDPMTTSTVLRTLQAKGFIGRKEHATDTRAKTVVMLDAGKKVAKQAIKVVEKFDHDFFSVLGGKVKDLNKKLNILIRS